MHTGKHNDELNWKMLNYAQPSIPTGNSALQAIIQNYVNYRCTEPVSERHEEDYRISFKTNIGIGRITYRLINFVLHQATYHYVHSKSL